MGIFARGKVWYYLFYVDGKRYSKSTKTANRHEAKRVAARAFVAVAGPELPISLQRSRVFNPTRVYLLKAGPNYKIGIAASVERRATDLQTGCPFPVEIIGQWAHGEVRKIERQLHEMFGHKKIRGEWFSLSDRDVDDIREYFKRKGC